DVPVRAHRRARDRGHDGVRRHAALPVAVPRQRADLRAFPASGRPPSHGADARRVPGGLRQPRAGDPRGGAGSSPRAVRAGVPGRGRPHHLHQRRPHGAARGHQHPAIVKGRFSRAGGRSGCHLTGDAWEGSMGKHWKLVALVAGSAMLGAVSASDTFPGKDTVVASEGRIGDRWMLAEGATLATPAYPAHLAGRGDDVCVALGYRILPDGSTTDFAVLKQWTSAGEGQQDDYWRAFAEAGADALSQWRFQPRPGVVARSTYTVATLAFSA